MQVAIAGSSGLIGTALTSALTSAGHTVLRLVRRPATGDGEIHWQPQTFGVEPGALRGCDAVVNLCGESVGAGRWTGALKQRIRDSRIITTRVLAVAAESDDVPSLINASAVGYYGDGGEEILTEDHPLGGGFLAGIVRDWEAVAEGDRLRVVKMRTGHVLSSSGGLLGALRPLYRWGMGGRMGSGRQYMPWISLEDEVRAILHLIRSDISGPVNLTAPHPITNRSFARAFGEALHRPAPWPIPGAALKAALGPEAAQEMLLFGQRTCPQVLLDSGFEFAHTDLEAALVYTDG